MPERRVAESPNPAASSFTDDRGTLIATELSDVPFAVSRVFTVRGPKGGAFRGNHAVHGAQLMVLVSGEVMVQYGADADHLESTVTLSVPGKQVLLTHGTHIRYRLTDETSSIIVFCERPFVSRD